MTLSQKSPPDFLLTFVFINTRHGEENVHVIYINIPGKKAEEVDPFAMMAVYVPIATLQCGCRVRRH